MKPIGRGLRSRRESMANFNFAEENKFILAEERTFLRQVHIIGHIDAPGRCP